jgi:hypothetical protein
MDLSSNQQQNRVLDMLTLQQPPVVPSWYLAQASRMTLSRLVASLRELSLSVRQTQDAKRRELVGAMITCAWPSLLSSLSALLGKRASSIFMKVCLHGTGNCQAHKQLLMSVQRVSGGVGCIGIVYGIHRDELYPFAGNAS